MRRLFALLEQLWFWIIGSTVAPTPGPPQQAKSKTRLLATILSGGNREALIGDAIRSAGFVDGVLFIRTDHTADEAIRVGVAVCEQLGLAHHVAIYPHEKFDTATARTFALQMAGELGYDWAATVDTDERLKLRDTTDGDDLRRELDAVKEQNVVLANIESGDYPKERFFRLPAHGHWNYRVHEAYEDKANFAITGSVTFWETPKSLDEMNALQRHVMAVCLEEIEAGVNPGRHWMYYASTLCHFKRHIEAAEAFWRAAELSEMPEHKGWSYFRAATMCHAVNAHELAIIFATMGMRHFPAMPELSWACAYSHWAIAKASSDAGELRVDSCMAALAMADECVAIGRQMTPDPHKQLRHFMPIRTYLQAPFTSYEGPWQIRRACLGLLGLVDDMKEADAMVNQALVNRTGKPESEQEGTN
jgi:hypothetical protein